ncbi:MAG: hypothetical protein ACHBN1_04185 [Heteroscytonema crispum UTEX LB 1556]
MVNGEGARSLQSGRFPPAHFAPLVGPPLRSWGLAKGRSGVFPRAGDGEPLRGQWFIAESP